MRRNCGLIPFRTHGPTSGGILRFLGHIRFRCRAKPSLWRFCQASRRTVNCAGRHRRTGPGAIVPIILQAFCNRCTIHSWPPQCSARHNRSFAQEVRGKFTLHSDDAAHLAQPPASACVYTPRIDNNCSDFRHRMGRNQPIYVTIGPKPAILSQFPLCELSDHANPVLLRPLSTRAVGASGSCL